MNVSVDVAVIGSGFSGSILAWILAKQGVRVALIDSAVHPRFAIGESSTPIADMVLRRLGQQYQLSELESLSTWGGWQKHHGDLACGRKRGFSYYVHSPGQTFHEEQDGDRSLMVAATASDEVADTHWFRSDVDHFFHARALQAGAVDLSGHTVNAHEVIGNSRYSLKCCSNRNVSVASDWIIDASGQAGVLAKLTAAVDLADQLRTRTHCLYGHYRNVGSWTQHLRQGGLDISRDPFDTDDAAQHHLLGHGWLWMLRFNNAITSVGFTAPVSHELDWSGYPSIETLFRNAELVGPSGRLSRSRRLQRLFDPIIGSRCIMLPTAAVTIDPIHSTGIAHALAGVDRVARIITESAAGNRDELVAQYGQAFLEETRLLDRLVSTAYATMSDFPRFTAACMLYFAAAIRCEERYQQGETPTHLWNGDDLDFVKMVDNACSLLAGEERIDDFHDEISRQLEPWNSAGLMNRAVKNRYARTATK
jgi:FADH2 O2-dependent halogenase